MTGRAGNDRQEQEHGTMSAERPAAGGPEPAPADDSVPAEAEVAGAPADAEPTLAEHTIEPTRTSMVWTMGRHRGDPAGRDPGLHPAERPTCARPVPDGGRHAPAWCGVAVRRVAGCAAGAGGGRGPGAAAAGGGTAPSPHRPGTVSGQLLDPLAMTTESHAFGNPTRG